MGLALQISGYAIQLHESDGHAFSAWPLAPFESFLCVSEGPPDLAVEVRVTEHLPQVPHGRLRFDACHGLWKLFESKTGYVLQSDDTKSLKPRCRAIVNPDFSRVEVWTQKQHSGNGPHWSPMHVINPIVEVCLLSRLARDGGLLVHAMGALMEGEGRVFTGASGSGKSTLADLFAARGACVLSDERIIVRKIGEQFILYGTPWVGISRHGKNQAGPLTGLYCIRHGTDRHAMHRMTPRSLSTFLLQQCFLPHWDRKAMERTLTIISDLSTRIDSFDLAFLKKPDVVDYLQA